MYIYIYIYIKKHERVMTRKSMPDRFLQDVVQLLAQLLFNRCCSIDFIYLVI